MKYSVNKIYNLVEQDKEFDSWMIEQLISELEMLKDKRYDEEYPDEV